MMDQQDSGHDAPPAADKQAPRAPQEQRPASQSANDSNWGIGSASALDQLRRHDFRARRSRPVDTGERPKSE